MRKPYPKMYLENAEFEILERVAYKSKIDTWFTLRDRIDSNTGECYTAVYDLERGAYVSLQFGVRLLTEGCSPLSEMGEDYWLDQKQVDLFKATCDKILQR